MVDLAFVTDGTAAVVGLALGLLNMGVNHCPNDGCLARNEVQPYTSLAISDVVFRGETVGVEAYFRHETRHSSGPFQFAYGASITSDDAVWVGLGATTIFHTPDDRWYAQFHVMPGLYEQGNGEDLGGPIIFRSGVEFGYQNLQGTRLGLSFDHRSNAGLYSSNPGLETVQFRVSFPTW